MMGEFLAAEAAGLKVTRYQQSGAIDYGKALKALLPTLDPRRWSPTGAHRPSGCASPRSRETATRVRSGQASTPWAEAA
jgi:hypothetical protein